MFLGGRVFKVKKSPKVASKRLNKTNFAKKPCNNNKRKKACPWRRWVVRAFPGKDAGGKRELMLGTFKKVTTNCGPNPHRSIRGGMESVCITKQLYNGGRNLTKKKTAGENRGWDYLTQNPSRTCRTRGSKWRGSRQDKKKRKSLWHRLRLNNHGGQNVKKTLEGKERVPASYKVGIKTYQRKKKRKCKASNQ